MTAVEESSFVPIASKTLRSKKVWKRAAFISGLIEVLISFTGNWVRNHIPRPAMLGALAGVALTFIAGEMLFKTFELPVIGLVVLAIIIVGIVGKVAMPFNIPSSLLAIIIGTVLAFVLGYSNTDKFHEGLGSLGFYPILPTLAPFEGIGLLFTTMIALLAVILPITLYNAIETMNNVDAMSAAGDSYDVRECQAVDGAGTMIGAMFGGLFPTTVYIATVGSKWMGAGRGYSILNAIVFFFAAMFGLIAAMSAIIPVAAIAPILVFVGISMVATAFQSNEQKYFPAIAIAMLPYFANYVMTRFNNSAGEVVTGISQGIVPVGQGAMFTAIVLGAITVFIIDKEFNKAAIFALVGATLSFFGFMHAPSLGINVAFDFTLGYVLIAGFFSYFAMKNKNQLQNADLSNKKKVA